MEEVLALGGHGVRAKANVPHPQPSPRRHASSHRGEAISDSAPGNLTGDRY